MLSMQSCKCRDFILLRGNTEHPTTTLFWAPKTTPTNHKASVLERRQTLYQEHCWHRGNNTWVLKKDKPLPGPLFNRALGYGWGLLVVMQAGCLCVRESQEFCACFCHALTERTPKKVYKLEKNRYGREYGKEDRRVLQICPKSQ